jgi:hypothetical protein
MRTRTCRLLGALLLAGTTAYSQETKPSIRLMGPRLEPERASALQRHGGSRATEQAVLAGLDWLARHQQVHGGWDADGFSDRCDKLGPACVGKGRGQHGEDVPCPFDHAISALATLAFLGRGIRPDGEGDAHGLVVERALRRLQSGGTRWGLVLATQALAEAEALEGKGRYRGLVHRRAMQFVRQIGRDGAWGYAPGMSRGSDVPYTALVVQALVAARDVGYRFPDGLEERVGAYLDTLEAKRGRLAYLKEGRRFGYTPTSENAACAAAVRALLQIGTKGKRHRMHMSLLARQRPRWKISFEEIKVPGRGLMKVQIGNLSLYRWWYGTIASFHAGGATWSSWNARLKSTLLSKQRKIGCSRGSWDPEGLYERQTGGRVFSTALAVLMLEQPYRHKRLGRR